MPIIVLNDSERLISTARVWEWQKKQKLKDRVTEEEIVEWVFFRNYMTAENALNDVAQSRIRVSKHEDILEATKDLKSEIQLLGKRITDTLSA